MPAELNLDLYQMQRREFDFLAATFVTDVKM